jgi:hypothetical protein
MNRSRGKSRYTTLRLEAFRAARRFASRGGNVESRRDAWRPLVLRWARRRRQQKNQQPERQVRPAPITYQMVFHSHLATHIANNTRISVTPLPMSTPVSAHARVLTDHRFTSVTVERPFFREVHPRRRSGALDAPNDRPGRERVPEHSTSRTAAIPIAPQLLRSPRQLARKRSADGAANRPATARNETFVTISKTRSHIRPHELRMFPTRVETVVISSPVSEAGSASMHFPRERAEQLVWRRTAPSRQTPTPDIDEPETTGAPIHKPVSKRTASEPELESTAAPQGAAAVQPIKLDPLILDRITNNVIDQVEKRIRIERERRGL